MAEKLRRLLGLWEQVFHNERGTATDGFGAERVAPMFSRVHTCRSSSARRWRRGMAGLLSFALLTSSLLAQNLTEMEKNRGVGDSPEVEGSLAQDLHPDLTHGAVRLAMRKVADWQLERARPYFNNDWTFAALYDGFMAASATLGDPKYERAMADVGKKLQWQLGK